MTETTKMNILIVEDDASVGKTLLGLLRQAGYECCWVATGQEALSLAQKTQPGSFFSVLLIDIRLPDIDGVKLLAAIKEIHPDIGAIMMTGHVDVNAAAGALNEGAFAYIQKPYNINEVKATIEKLQDKQRLIRENRVLVERLQKMNAELETKVQERTQALQNAYLELLKTVKKLKELDAAKSRFVLMVSHELRTPLAAILGFTETLINKFDKLNRDAVFHCLRIIEKEGNRLARLIKEVLDLSRLQEAEIKLQYQAFDLQEMADAILSQLKDMRPDVNFVLRLDAQARSICSDRDQVHQVFLHLLSNAAKYSPGQGEVVLAAQRVDGSVEISVSDSGPGIAEPDQEKIFEPFYRTPDEVNMRSPGTGLGLTITRAILHALGGRISLESQFGKGSTFKVLLPDGNNKRSE